ncbi:MAG: hypothetical protein WCI30_04400 [Clostridia bacterium]
MKTNTSEKSITSRVSGRELILLAAFLVFLELYFLFFQILVPKYQDYQAQRTINTALSQTVADLKVEFGKMDQYLATLATAQEEEQVMKSMIPPYTAHEEVILFLDKLLTDAQLMVNVISFDTLTTVEQGVFLTPTPEQQAATSTEAATAVAPVVAPTGTGYLVADQEMSLSFSGSYGSIYSFLNLLETSNRKAFVKSLSLSADEKGMLTGNMNISMLSLVDAAKMEQYKLDLAAIAGKDSPFTPYQGYGVSKDSATPVAALLIPDFTMLLNTYLDNAPKVILSDYQSAAAQLTADANRSFAARLSLNRSGSGYSYTMSLDGKNLSSAAPLTVRNGRIVLEVISQTRSSNKDLAGATLDIINNTNVPMRVVVTKDDANIPRFKLGNISGDVKIGL